MQGTTILTLFFIKYLDILWMKIIISNALYNTISGLNCTKLYAIKLILKGPGHDFKGKFYF